MTNLKFHPKVAPESTANSAGAPKATSNDEALESLRHNQTHTLPPGARVAWLSHRLQDLPEEHLRATDDLCPEAENAAGVQSAGALRGSSSRRRMLIALLAGLAAALVGAIAFYVFASESRSANQPTQAMTHSAPASAPVASHADESPPVTSVAKTPPRVSASEKVTREPVAAPRHRAPAVQDKPKQAAPPKKVQIKTDTPPAEPNPAVDEILFKSR